MKAYIVIIIILTGCGCVSPSAVLTIQEDVQKLKTENESLKSRMDEFQKEVENLKSTPTPGTEPSIEIEEVEEPVPLLEMTPVKQVPEKLDSDQVYSKAMSLYQAKSYRDAVISFEQASILSNSSEMKAKCLYWTGECYYALGAYQRALEFFIRVTDEYPDGLKTPDAQLKIGFTYYELKEYDKSVQALEDFLKKHPSHRAVSLAREKVDAIKDLQSQKQKADSTSSKKESRR